MTRTLVTAIVSTAAPGAESGALDAAIELGIGYGGRTHATELPPIYAARMRGVDGRGMAVRLNVQDSDGTLIVSFAWPLSGRSKHAGDQCKQQRKPARHLILPAGGRTRIPDAVRAALLQWIDDNHVSVLHVVGPGEEHEPGIAEATRDALVWVLEDDHAGDVQQSGMPSASDVIAAVCKHGVSAAGDVLMERFPEAKRRYETSLIDSDDSGALARSVDATGALTADRRTDLEASIRQAESELKPIVIETTPTAEFLAELLDVPQPLDEAEFLRLREAFYRLPDNGAGGSLHVVLDDNNWERSSVEFCRKWAADRNDIAGVRFAELLLTLTDEQLHAWIGAGYCGRCGADAGDAHVRSDLVQQTFPIGRCPECGSWPAVDPEGR